MKTIKTIEKFKDGKLIERTTEVVETADAPPLQSPSTVPYTPIQPGITWSTPSDYNCIWATTPALEFQLLSCN